MSVMYGDRIIYREEVVEASLRRPSLELNVSRAYVRGVRVYAGAWGISSVQGDGEIGWDELMKIAYRNALTVSRPSKPKFFEEGLFKGRYVVGKSVRDPDEVLDRLEVIKRAADDRGVEVEAFITVTTRQREIAHPEGVALEVKTVVEVLVYAIMRSMVASSSLAYTGSLNALTEERLERMVDEALTRLSAAVNARGLSLLERGKKTVVLSHECSAALFHELAHLLEADGLAKIAMGTRISTVDINLRDDPLLPWSPAFQRFDDEVYPTFRRTLIEGGEVVSLLHTRTTAADYNDVPGNARGLFHVPKAMHTTLVVSPGDWVERELIEETREGVLVDGVVISWIQDGVVHIRPEASWIIRRGEIFKPVKVNCVKIPLSRALNTIDAMSKVLQLRHSYEKGHLVAEMTPMVRLEAYVE